MDLVPANQRLADTGTHHALLRLLSALKGRRNADVPLSHVLRQLGIVLMPGLLFVLLATSSYRAVTTVQAEPEYDIEPISFSSDGPSSTGGLQEPSVAGGLAEPAVEGG